MRVYRIVGQYKDIYVYFLFIFCLNLFVVVTKGTDSIG